MMSPSRRHRLALRLARLVAAVLAASVAAVGARAGTDDDDATAKSLAAMLRAGRTIVSRHQAEINDPNVGDKGFTGAKLLAEAKAVYKEATGEDADAVDPATKRGRLLKTEMDSMKSVVDANQDTINEKGLGFKGFIPATFARLTSETFNQRAVGEAELKVTAPPDLVRNLKAEPDGWEKEVIKDDFEAANWPKGKEFSAVTEKEGHSAFRMAAPEYYATSCLSCHGAPKGEIDMTGYPKEGAAAGDLGGVISVSLFH